MKLAKRVRPNSRGEGAFWLFFLVAKKSRLTSRYYEPTPNNQNANVKIAGVISKLATVV